MTTYKSYFLSLSAALLLLISFPCLAQNDANELYVLELEDLMDIKVSSSTKSTLTIQKAPSVIRTFTKEDFQHFGFQTLSDVLNAVPGHQSELYRSNHRNIWVRGVQSRYNNKVLMLIDGMPYRDSFYGHISSNFAIPLEMIEKVEIINGPGSVLYGANSFAGVISITTKHNTRDVGASYGSFGTYQLYSSYATKHVSVFGKLL